MLLLPQNGFRHYIDNMAITDGAFPLGTAITSGGSANTDGTAVTLLSALGNDVHFLQVSGSDFVTNGQTARVLLDILIDPAGGSSWAELIPDLVCGQSSSQGGMFYEIPIYIPAGASVGAQCRSSVASNTGIVTVAAYGEPVRPDMWWCGRKVEAIGIDAANSNGTDITSGNGTFGAWTNVGSTTTVDYGALFAGCNGGINAMAVRQWLLEFGVSSTPLPIGRICLTSTTGELTSYLPFMTPICNVKAGSQLQCRSADSSGTMDINVALYGVY